MMAGFVAHLLFIKFQAGEFPKQSQSAPAYWWVWFILVVLVAILIIWLHRSGKKTESDLQPDDLTIIEGIGPKIAELLKSRDIRTFRQLAKTDTAKLNQILHEASLNIANPETWARQAHLAAEQKWDELKALQENLKGGRQV